jgi:hypothetical protein
MDLKEVFFTVLCVFHILLWCFILLAFLNKKLASFNLYYLVPFVYIIQLLPFHVLTRIKESMYKDNWEEKNDTISSSMYPVKVFLDMRKSLTKVCFENPISNQGMLIFGAITSAYAIKKSRCK